MAFQTRNDGVIVKLPLSKFKELKENNQLADNEAYVISDIDEHLELPLRLTEDTLNNQVYGSAIDDTVTGFYLWDCYENTQYRPDINEPYYYIYSIIATANNKTKIWGSQIAITESTNKMYFRSRGDNGWNDWKRVLNATDDTSGSSSTEEYWQVRNNRVIGNGECLFFNTSKTDFSDVPLGNLLLQEEESESSYYIKFLQEGNAYKLVWYNTAGTYTSSDIIAYGFSRSNMIWSKSYWQYTHETNGDYVKISQVIENHDLIDNLMRINNTGF
jgi:hypothetical protein